MSGKFRLLTFTDIPVQNFVTKTSIHLPSLNYKVTHLPQSLFITNSYDLNETLRSFTNKRQSQSNGIQRTTKLTRSIEEARILMLIVYGNQLTMGPSTTRRLVDVPRILILI